MAFSSHCLMISALLICLCSADVTSKTGGTTMNPEPTTPTESETSPPAESTSQPEPTTPTESETSPPAESTSQPEPTTPTESETSPAAESTSQPEPTTPTESETSPPAESTSQPEPTTPTESETSLPTQTTSVTEPTNTVTSESAHTTSTEMPSTTELLLTQSTEPPSSPPTAPPTTTPTLTPSSLPTDPPNTLPTTQPTTPPTDPPTTPPATTTTQTTNRPIPTAGPFMCQNGGYFNGSICICLVGFGGDFCQYFDTVEPVTLNRSVEVNVLLNQEFNDNYGDKTSSEYKEFVRNFTNQMKTYYAEKNIPHFPEVVVTSVRRGESLVRLSDKTVEKVKLFKRSAEAMAVYSITPRAEGVSVTHDVVLAIPNDAILNQLYDNDFTAVQKAVDELVGCTDCPFNITALPGVKRTELDLGSLCETLVGKNDVAKYEAVRGNNGAIRCVNLCDSLHSTPTTCNYMGTCRLYSSIGPFCDCQNIDSTWYLGDDCSFPILRTAFYLGLSVTLACLLVTVGALTAYLLCNKRKQKLQRDVKNLQVNQWLTEDFQWSRPNSCNDTLNAGEYNNPSFTHEESATHREMPVVYRRPAPVYQPNGPSMDTGSRQWSPTQATYPSSQTAYGHNRPFSNAGLSRSTSLNLRDFSSNLMRINRPQIRTSWDA